MVPHLGHFDSHEEILYVDDFNLPSPNEAPKNEKKDCEHKPTVVAWDYDYPIDNKMCDNLNCEDFEYELENL